MFLALVFLVLVKTGMRFLFGQNISTWRHRSCLLNLCLHIVCCLDFISDLDFHITLFKTSLIATRYNWQLWQCKTVGLRVFPLIWLRPPSIQNMYEVMIWIEYTSLTDPPHPWCFGRRDCRLERWLFYWWCFTWHTKLLCLTKK